MALVALTKFFSDMSNTGMHIQQLRIINDWQETEEIVMIQCGNHAGAPTHRRPRLLVFTIMSQLIPKREVHGESPIISPLVVALRFW